MALEGYNDAQELVMTGADKMVFEIGFRTLKDTCIKAGFDETAVNSLQFKVSEHTLTISDEDRSKGAFHIHGDGKPFYAITVEAPGSPDDMANADPSIPVTKRPLQQQAMLLAYELGINLMPRMSQMLKAYYGLADADGKLAGGGSMGFDQVVCETTMRCDPIIYCRALNDYLAIRLNQIAPAPAVPATKAARTSTGPRS